LLISDYKEFKRRVSAGDLEDMIRDGLFFVCMDCGKRDIPYLLGVYIERGFKIVELFVICDTCEKTHHFRYLEEK